MHTNTEHTFPLQAAFLLVNATEQLYQQQHLTLQAVCVHTHIQIPPNTYTMYNFLE